MCEATPPLLGHFLPKQVVGVALHATDGAPGENEEQTAPTVRTDHGAMQQWRIHSIKENYSVCSTRSISSFKMWPVLRRGRSRYPDHVRTSGPPGGASVVSRVHVALAPQNNEKPNQRSIVIIRKVSTVRGSTVTFVVPTPTLGGQHDSIAA